MSQCIIFISYKIYNTQNVRIINSTVFDYFTIKHKYKSYRKILLVIKLYFIILIP